MRPSCTWLYAKSIHGFDSGDAPPGRMYLPAQVNVTSKTPGRSAEAPKFSPIKCGGPQSQSWSIPEEGYDEGPGTAPEPEGVNFVMGYHEPHVWEWGVQVQEELDIAEVSCTFGGGPGEEEVKPQKLSIARRTDRAVASRTTELHHDSGSGR
jgi:hypothetical protein